MGKPHLALLSFALLAACGSVSSEQPDAPPSGPDAATDASIDADPCTAATCECTVATESTDCGAHEYCNVAGTSRTCDCVAGYTTGVSGCVWTGSVVDPEIATSTGWTMANGALLNPTAVGGVDPGEVSFLPSSLCSLGNAQQTLMMPTYAKAEPLVLELSYKNQLDFMNFDRVLMGVSFDGGWSPFGNFNDANFHTVRICLPEGGYAPAGTPGAGGPVTLALGPYLPPDRCPNSTVSNFAIDHAEIVPANAGECGTPGQGPNFDAEGTGGWTFTVSGSSTGNFVNGAGVGGSRAAQLKLGARCDGAAMETWFNVPRIANPALEMFVAAGPGANASITFGQSLFSVQAAPAGMSRTLRACLPPSLRGQTMSMRFSLSGGSGLCSQILDHTVSADNVRVVDDPACATSAGFTNAGFERTGDIFGAFGTASSSTATATVRTDAANAHGGTAYLALESQGRCSSSGFAMLPTVPMSSGASGPALKLFARAGANPDAATTISVRGGANQTVTEGGGYQPYTVCLNPRFAGRPQQVFVSHQGGSGLCDNSNYTPQSVFIDDIQVTTDSACPAQ